MMSYHSKIITLKDWKIRQQNEAETVVFTNGCFDVLHFGHIDYLWKAKALGNCLVVGLNSDASVKRLKGAARPINCQEARAALMASLQMVDFVIVFEEDTPLQLIQQLQPNILVKGGDYSISEIVGAEEVMARGGSVTTIPFVTGYSSTHIINTLK